MTSNKPVASLSLDLDDLWSYLKTHGDAGWTRFHSYLDVVVPRTLNFFRERDWKITYFVVGQDAAMEKNRETLRAVADDGHEIGNHSFHHEPWLHLFSEAELESELERAEEAIEAATGHRTLGFRGPGFSCSESVLNVLARRGYRYDASTFPTYLGPLARAYYFMTARLTAEQRREREKLFGTVAEGLRPIQPYRWDLGPQTLLEIPVSTMPLFKLPIHISYVLYLAVHSPITAMAYWRTALTICRMAGVRPSILLHPLDFLGCDDTDELAFFPAMRCRAVDKLRIVEKALDLLGGMFDVVTMAEHAESIAGDCRLPLIKPRFGCAQKPTLPVSVKSSVRSQPVAPSFALPLAEVGS